MTRLILSILLFLVSLVAICRAFTFHMWILAIGVTEYPWLFAGITILVLVAGFWFSKYQLPGTVIGIIAFILFLSPIFRAYIVSGKINQQFDSAFGTKTTGDKSPFNFFRMFAGNGAVAY